LHAPVIKPAASNFFDQDAHMKLYVGNLSFRTNEPELEQLFASVGQVTSVNLVRDRATGQSRGFGFVEMADEAQGRAACEQLNEREFEGRRLTVNEARPQEARSGGFGGNRGGGGGFGGNRGGGGGGGRQRRDSRW
jgi:RNA recognition motif-containing protein